MLAGGNEKFPPANILSFLPSHYNDYHAFVSSTEHGFFRILGEMSLRGQEKRVPHVCGLFTWRNFGFQLYKPQRTLPM